ncbi:hypothetical protein HWV62_3995 [Athelia sp. TMB]|nr:hypothetical protein HWV62_3995 [Athelia sp. TMB]
MDKILDGVPTTRAVQASLGVCFAGFVVCVGLWGVSLAQTAFYFYHFPRDGRFRKIMVLCMSIVDCVHISFISSLFWDMLIYNRFNHVNASAAIGHPWQMFVSPTQRPAPHALTPAQCFFPTLSIMEMTTQGFFCHRVWRVSRGNRALVVIIITCMLAAPVALLVGLFHGPFPELPMTTIVPLNLIPLLIVDGTIYGALVYYFNASRLGMPRCPPLSALLLPMLMDMEDGAGAEAADLAQRELGAAALYERDTDDPASILAPTFILSQLYMNSMMAALNTRKHFRALIDRTITDSIYVSETSQLAVE